MPLNASLDRVSKVTPSKNPRSAPEQKLKTKYAFQFSCRCLVNKSMLMQLRTYADNVALPAFAHSAAIDISRPPGTQQQTRSSRLAAVVKVDRRVRWHYMAFVHDSRGIEIVNFTISHALSAGTLMASAGTPYRLVPANFTPG